MSDVVELPTKQRSCFDCEHYILTPTSAGYCWLLKEGIDDETVAQNCEEFQPWLAP